MTHFVSESLLIYFLYMRYFNFVINIIGIQELGIVLLIFPTCFHLNTEILINVYLMLNFIHFEFNTVSRNLNKL